MASSLVPSNPRKVENNVTIVRNKKRITSQKVNLSPVWLNRHGSQNNINLCFHARMTTDNPTRTAAWKADQTQRRK